MWSIKWWITHWTVKQRSINGSKKCHKTLFIYLFIHKCSDRVLITPSTDNFLLRFLDFNFQFNESCLIVSFCKRLQHQSAKIGTHKLPSVGSENISFDIFLILLRGINIILPAYVINCNFQAAKCNIMKICNSLNRFG